MTGLKISIAKRDAKILEQLATEDETSVSKLLHQLVVKEDERRHIQFQHGKGHVRVKCLRPRCLEKQQRAVHEYGD